MEQNTSNPLMTKYEFTRMVCARVQQLSEGAPSTLPDMEAVRPLEVAVRELEAGKLPMMVQREMPDGSKEVWKSRDLVLPQKMMDHVRTLLLVGREP